MVLPVQVNQQVLPAITADTTEIHKLIDQMYNKTIIVPGTHTYEVTHYVQTPQGLVKKPEPINSFPLASTAPEALLPQKQIEIPQAVIPLPQVLAPQTQVFIPQTQVIAPESQVVVPQPQVIVPQGQIIDPRTQLISIQPISRLSINQRNSFIQPASPITQSFVINPAPQLVNQPMIRQSLLTQPLSTSYSPSMVMNAI